ncbi:cytochrome C biogenesis protein [Methanosarcinales archaeon ex4572_44]|nr:MAG: cytochrome C biogenesis protein [Methanosarcinales archaeon ex4572_44]
MVLAPDRLGILIYFFYRVIPFGFLGVFQNTLFLVFVAGLGTILSPCVLPILPAVLSGSVGSRFRPLAIVVGVSVTFTTMGVFASLFGAGFMLFEAYLRWFSIVFIIAMGLVLFDERIGGVYTSLASRAVSAVKLPAVEAGGGGGVLGGFALGLSLGVLWIPCVGPILGAVLAYVAAGAAGSGSLFYGAFQLFVYSLGVGVPMLLIAYSGKTISGRSSKIARYAPFFKKISGFVLLFVGIMMLSGVDKIIQQIL